VSDVSSKAKNSLISLDKRKGKFKKEEKSKAKLKRKVSQVSDKSSEFSVQLAKSEWE
jgi:hypothetical protein